MRKRFSPEQIANKLREADVLISKGNTAAKVCTETGVADQTEYRWHPEFDGRSEETERSEASPLIECWKITMQMSPFVNGVVHSQSAR